jgi:hypothetical protein
MEIIFTGTDCAVCYNLNFPLCFVSECHFCAAFRLCRTFHKAAKVKGIGEFVNIRSGLPTPAPNKCSLRPCMKVVTWNRPGLLLSVYDKYTVTYCLSRTFSDLKGVHDSGYGKIGSVSPLLSRGICSISILHLQLSSYSKNFDECGNRRQADREFSKKSRLKH